jgi:hypothetical protein
MFMLYGLLLGVATGLALGGSLRQLAEFQFRWWPLAIGALLAQVALFSPALTGIGTAGPVLYVASTALVLIAIFRNLRTAPGFAVVAIGAASNLLAIVANGGYMPVSPEALAASGRSVGVGYSNSIASSRPMFEALVDRFVMPSSLPFANVFSVGDVLISIGLLLVIVRAMRTAPEPIAGGVR